MWTPVGLCDLYSFARSGSSPARVPFRALEARSFQVAFRPPKALSRFGVGPLPLPQRGLLDSNFPLFPFFHSTATLLTQHIETGVSRSLLRPVLTKAYSFSRLQKLEERLPNADLQTVDPDFFARTVLGVCNKRPAQWF